METDPLIVLAVVFMCFVFYCNTIGGCIMKCFNGIKKCFSSSQENAEATASSEIPEHPESSV